jgi:lambda family phage holin
MSSGEDPAVLHTFWDLLPEPFKAAILATIIAIFRVMYDGREPRFLRRAMEACLCGFIAFGLAAGLESIDVPSGMATFLGAAVGLLGADKVREFAQQYVTSRVDKETKD